MTTDHSSLRRRLVRRLIPALAFAVVLGGVSAYVIAKRSADFAYDQALVATAADIAGGVRVEAGDAAFELSSQSERIVRSDARDDIFFAVRLADGRFVGGDRDLAARPVGRGGDERSESMVFRDRPVRAMSLPFVTQGTAFVVTIAETTRKRQAVAWSIFAEMMGPTVLVLSLACALVWLSIRDGLQPLEELRRAIEDRSERDLSPIATLAAPSEVRSLIGALNRLLSRLDVVTRAHQAFVADSAHQLRTPLAGIQAQIELLSTPRASVDDAADRITLVRLRVSVERAVRLVHQLLALARSEADTHPLRAQAFDLCTSIGDAADGWVHRAIDAQIDLGFDLGRAPLDGDPYLVRELLENLVDNAVRHTPVGGRITVGTSRDDDATVLLTVDDSGPGVPDDERDRIFDRFHRLDRADATGSGLGLAIVRRIAARHGGTVDARRSMSLGGLRITVRFPAAGGSTAGGLGGRSRDAAARAG